jgi:hypothetical protein
LAHRDRRAVDDAGEDRGELAGHHGDHDFVQQRHSLRDALLQNQRPAPAEPGEHGEIDVAASLGDLVRPDKVAIRGVRVALEHDRQCGQEQEPPPFGAILRRGLQHASTAGDPTHCRGKFTPKEQSACLPKRASCGTADLASARVALVRAEPGGRAVAVVAD